MFPLIFRALLRSVATTRRDILELWQKYKKGGECHAHSSEVCLAGLEAWEHSRGRVSRKLTSWNFGVLITRIFIPYPRVSLVYGSTCSLLVLSYYKCLLRLNSDIAKPLPVFQCPRKSLKTNLEFSRNSVRKLPIHHYKGRSRSSSGLVCRVFTGDTSQPHQNKGIHNWPS